MNETKKDVIEILRRQLELLAEMSRKKDITNEDLHRFSGEMDRIAATILRECAD